MAFFFLLIGLYASIFPPLITAREIGHPPLERTVQEARGIIEANRLLEEELKLAARPHIYMVLDLAGHVIVIKNRGIELQRLPVTAWRQAGGGSVKGVFRLRARPPVSRPKAAVPADNTPLTAIELRTMPDRYDLAYDPRLLISVGQTARERPWPWIKSLAQNWWNHVAGLLGIAIEADGATAVRIHLTLAQETAQSLAWTLTDGMPLIIGRAAPTHD